MADGDPNPDADLAAENDRLREATANLSRDVAEWAVRHARASAELNALVKAIPREWSSNHSPGHVYWQRVQQIVSAGTRFDHRQPLRTAAVAELLQKWDEHGFDGSKREVRRFIIEALDEN